jgi:hypothetical protein
LLRGGGRRGGALSAQGVQGECRNANKGNDNDQEYVLFHIVLYFVIGKTGD